MQHVMEQVQQLSKDPPSFTTSQTKKCTSKHKHKLVKKKKHKKKHKKQQNNIPFSLMADAW